MEVLAFYFSSGADRRATLEKYGIDHSCLRDWLAKYPTERKVVTLLAQIDNDMSAKYKRLPSDPAKAQAEYERIQRELEEEQLRSRAYSCMIEVAEKEFNIPIRKKSGAKQ